MKKFVSILIVTVFIATSVGSVLGTFNGNSLDPDLEIVGVSGGLGLTVKIRNNGFDRTPEYPWEIFTKGSVVFWGSHL